MHLKRERIHKYLMFQCVLVFVLEMRLVMLGPALRMNGSNKAGLGCFRYSWRHVHKWSELVRLGLNWSELVTLGLNWSELVTLGLNWSKLVGIGQNWSYLTRIGQKSFHLSLQGGWNR